MGTRRYERRKQRGVATWNVRAVVRRSSAPRGQTVQVFYCVKLYSKSAPSNSIFEAGQVQGKGRPQWQRPPPRGLYAPVLWAGSALPIEPNLIITIDADLPTPQTPPSPPILMRGGMESLWEGRLPGQKTIENEDSGIVLTAGKSIFA